jgi:hypothetical protein
MNLPSELFFTEFKKTQGALSVCEAIAIHNILLQAPAGMYLELGSHKGKSGMSAATALKEGVFVLIDPIFSDLDLGAEVCDKVRSFTNASLDVIPIADFSTNVISLYEDLSYVFVDSGSHCDGLPMQEVKMLEDRMTVNGIIAFHDYRNQFTEVAEAYDYLLSTGKYERIDIPWDQIKAYVTENNLEAGNSSWHMPGVDLPCFVGAVKRKA